jgi:DNA-binding NarL/FixJ family response regulator
MSDLNIRREAACMDRIVIADDHPLFREALTRAVLGAAPGAEIVTCSSLAGLETALAAGEASLILLDLKMPDCDGFTGLLRLREAHPTTPVIVVSASEDRDTVRRALALGASGFIPKSTDLDGMIEGLSAVLDGEIWTPPLAGHDPTTADDPRMGRLTPAQRAILVGLQRGRLNKQIAFDMGVTEATVKAHMTAIFRKLGVQNRTQAVLVAQSLPLGD